MKTRSFTRIGFGLAVGLLLAQNAGAQSISDQMAQQKADYETLEQQRDPLLGTSSAPAASPVAVPAAPSASQVMQQQLQQQAMGMGMSMLQQGVHDLIYGSPEDKARQAQQQAEQQAAQQAQEQSQIAAWQLNDSGVWYLRQKNYAGAIVEFQKALTRNPNDQTILNNLALAKQQQQNAAVAAQTSSALGQLLGNAPANSGTFDFDQLTPAAAPSPNVSALSLVNLGSDPNVVDLSGTTKTSIDPAVLKNDPATVATDQKELQKELDQQFDDLAKESQKDELAARQQAQGEQRQMDADFDKLYNESVQNRPSPVSMAPATDTDQKIQAMDQVLDQQLDKDLKSQLDDFSQNYLPQHPALASTPATVGVPAQSQKLADSSAVGSIHN